MRACFSVKYATADTHILTTKGQILKVSVSGVSGLVSGVFMGSPLVFGGICPRICALLGYICLFMCRFKHLYISLLLKKPVAVLQRLEKRDAHVDNKSRGGSDLKIKIQPRPTAEDISKRRCLLFLSHRCIMGRGSTLLTAIFYYFKI